MRPKTYPKTIRLTDRQHDALLRESVAQQVTAAALVGMYCETLAKRHAAEDKRKEAAQ